MANKPKSSKPWMSLNLELKENKGGLINGSN